MSKELIATEEQQFRVYQDDETRKFEEQIKEAFPGYFCWSTKQHFVLCYK